MLDTDFKKYAVAVALRNFATAWLALTDATGELPDLDLNMAYPFYLLDFELLTPAVITWTRLHAKNLLDECHIYVRNPDCLKNCAQWNTASITLDNKCTTSAACTRYPLVPFDADKIDLVLKEYASVQEYTPGQTAEQIYSAYQVLLDTLAKPVT